MANYVENQTIWQANYWGADGRRYTFYVTAESWKAALSIAEDYSSSIHAILIRIELLPDTNSGTVRPAVLLIDGESL